MIQEFVQMPQYTVNAVYNRDDELQRTLEFFNQYGIAKRTICYFYFEQGFYPNHKLFVDESFFLVSNIFVRAIAEKIYKDNISDGTIQKYISDFNRFLGSMGNKSIHLVDKDFLTGYTTSIISNDNVIPTAFRNYKTVLYLIFRYAVRHHIIENNIVCDLEPYEFFLDEKMNIQNWVTALRELYSDQQPQELKQNIEEHILDEKVKPERPKEQMQPREQQQVQKQKQTKNKHIKEYCLITNLVYLKINTSQISKKINMLGCVIGDFAVGLKKRYRGDK